MSEKKQTPFIPTSLNLEFVDFDINPNFTGLYQQTVQIGEGDKEFTANVFTDLNTGENVFITNAYAIEKGIRIAKEKLGKEFQSESTVFEIIFKGKKSLGDKQYNQFDVSYCTLPEYEAWVKPTAKTEK